MKTLCNIPILVVSILFITSCIKPSWDTSEQSGEAAKPTKKSCKIYSYKLNEDSNLEEGILMEAFEYDIYGRATKLVRYDSAGEVISTFDYKYDQSGNLTEKIWKEASQKKGDHIRSTTYTYDLGGAATKQKDDAGKNEKYDKSGNLVERIWSDPLKKSGIKETHHYYKGGKQREVQYFNETNELEKKTVFAYDSLGNETSMIDYDRDGKIESKITYNYDEYGNIKEDIYWNVKDSIPYQIIKYIYEFY